MTPEHNEQNKVLIDEFHAQFSDLRSDFKEFQDETRAANSRKMDKPSLGIIVTVLIFLFTQTATTVYSSAKLSANVEKNTEALIEIMANRHTSNDQLRDLALIWNRFDNNEDNIEKNTERNDDQDSRITELEKNQ